MRKRADYQIKSRIRYRDGQWQNPNLPRINFILRRKKMHAVTAENTQGPHRFQLRPLREIEFLISIPTISIWII